MGPKVFIDGDAGTTGLQIVARLEGRRDLSLLRLPEDRRKDPEARREALNACDLAVLCLPDAAAREAVAMIDNPETRVLDASTAHRTAEGWVYGLPEMDAAQAEAVRGSKRVANPGCYPTGAILILRPLVRAGLLPADTPVTVNAVSGYSGGGKALIARYEGETADGPDFFAYGLDLKHKHLPEMQACSGLSHAPIFQPSVGRFRQGMLVSVPLHLWSLPGRPAAPQIHETLSSAYAGQRFLRVEPLAAAGTLDPQALNGSNDVAFHVFADASGERCLISAVLDNLGKGASGAAVQNLNLMLGLEEVAGLEPAIAA
ncbi:N-acetyl-gamma-glutamyl-phosphate reductase [Algihabitans albus]|uniref:N-acetyl-gamma-glutamyl-phosphate reductase n=1 Tax=Algihabitans albus TaxID=2164067 RepID=UPI000E5CE2CD|nr:N-acetyl-gamma-glutamyl-phosphate reductase [Algihabitans albus]